MPSVCFIRDRPSPDSAQGDTGHRSGSIRAERLCILGVSPRAADSIRRILRALQQLSGARRGADCRHSAAYASKRSLSAPADVGGATLASRASTPSPAFRGAVRPRIVGVSHIRTQPYSSRTVRAGPIRVHRRRSPLDRRWRAGRVASGSPAGRSTEPRRTGWHADVMVHRPVMGPVTAVWRSEQLDYDASAPFARCGAATYRRRPRASASESQRAGQRPSSERRL